MLNQSKIETLSLVCEVAHSHEVASADASNSSGDNDSSRFVFNYYAGASADESNSSVDDDNDNNDLKAAAAMTTHSPSAESSAVDNKEASVANRVVNNKRTSNRRPHSPSAESSAVDDDGAPSPSAESSAVDDDGTPSPSAESSEVYEDNFFQNSADIPKETWKHEPHWQRRMEILRPAFAEEQWTMKRYFMALMESKRIPFNDRKSKRDFAKILDEYYKKKKATIDLTVSKPATNKDRKARATKKVSELTKYLDILNSQVNNVLQTLTGMRADAAIIAAANTGDGDNGPPTMMGTTVRTDATIVAPANTEEGDNGPPMWMGEVNADLHSFILKTCLQIESKSQFGRKYGDTGFGKEQWHELSSTHKTVRTHPHIHVLSSTHALLTCRRFGNVCKTRSKLSSRKKFSTVSGIIVPPQPPPLPPPTSLSTVHTRRRHNKRTRMPGLICAARGFPSTR